MGLQEGDVILEINRKKIETPKDFEKATKDINLEKGLSSAFIEGVTPSIILSRTALKERYTPSEQCPARFELFSRLMAVSLTEPLTDLSVSEGSNDWNL